MLHVTFIWMVIKIKWFCNCFMYSQLYVDISVVITRLRWNKLLNTIHKLNVYTLKKVEGSCGVSLNILS